MRNKLMVIGSNSIHTYTFITLIHDYFEEIILLTNEKQQNVDFKVIELDFRLKNFQTIFQIKKIANTFQPTHIHIHQANSYAFLSFLALKNYPAKKILNAWGSDILLNPKKNFLFKQMVKFNLKQADIIVADSDTVLKEATRLVSDIKTENINFGIDFIECNKSKEKIIYSNRLHKSLYNIDKIIYAFNKFVKKNPEWKLVIAGDGEDTPKLKKIVYDFGIEKSVDFIGFVDKKTNFHYYCKSKIYISIPQSDSVSLSLVEAIVSGCVVFVSDLDANKEVVDVTTGIILDNLENIDFLRFKKVDRMLQVRSINYLKKKFSKEYNNQRYREIYEY